VSRPQAGGPHLEAARLTIDLDALAHNFAVLRADAGGAEVAPVVKSDGYGLGVAEVGCRLWRESARSFFVARLSEGEALRRALGPTRPATIYVLDGLIAGSGPRLLAADLTPALSSLDQVTAAAALAAGLGRPLPCALHLDSGMSRQGLAAAEARALALAPDRLRGLDIGLVMSHLGSAANPAHPRNRRQLDAFCDLRRLFPGGRASLAASAGLYLGPEFRFDMVRPGISLYGGGPLERPDPKLQAVVRLEAPLVDIRNVMPGDFVGYGANVVARRPMRLGLVGAGYADGVIRAAAGRGHGWAAGARRPFVIVNMDLIALDLGDADVRLGDTVELLGPNARLDDLAAAAGTVAHECLVRLSRRIERVYVGQ
jgi:alanine racemase